ncbi:MAG: MCE family protein [Paracoccaceae bacterium]|nr:MCE family protein [Paracoccaceae bacterium]
METRANYVLIGAFTLVGILAALGFFLWLAKVEVDRQYAYYDILFDSVSGLGEAGDVRYNGLPVGQVTRLSLDQDDPSKVRVRIEIGAEVPVKEDTIGTLELQGVTGVSYVSLSGGTPGSRLLREASDQRIPVIASQPSAVQTLFEGIPAVMNEAVALIKHLNEVAGPENRDAVNRMLGNLERASGNLDQALKDFSALSADLSAASATIAGFTGRLDGVADAAVTTLNTTDDTLKTARAALEKAQPMIENATDALASAREGIDSADALMNSDLPKLIVQLEATATAVQTVVNELGGKTDGVIAKINTVGDRAIARLDQAEATLAKLDTALDTATATMAAIGDTARSVDELAKGDAAALVAEARQAVTGINTAVTAANKVMSDDLPVIIADIKSTVSRVDQAVATTAADISGASGRLEGIVANADGAIVAATETFRNANTTLSAVTRTLDNAEGTLGAAEKTFTGINRILDEEAEAIIADIRTSVTSLSGAVDRVSADLPQVTSDLRSTLARTSQFVANLDSLVVDNSDQIEAFMQAGLPQFVRFVQEGSRLIQNLQRLTTKIESNPARFLLGTQAPEFRN